MACGPHQTSGLCSSCERLYKRCPSHNVTESRCFSFHTPNHRNIDTWWPLHRPAELRHSYNNVSLQYQVFNMKVDKVVSCELQPRRQRRRHSEDTTSFSLWCSEDPSSPRCCCSAAQNWNPVFFLSKNEGEILEGKKRILQICVKFPGENLDFVFVLKELQEISFVLGASFYFIFLLCETEWK